MPTERGDPASDAQALRAALDEAVAGLPDEDRANAPDAVDDDSLAIGLRIGLERPAEARRLLELVTARAPERAMDGTATNVSPAPTQDTGELVADRIPILSMLLARAAAVPVSDLASQGSDAMFGWAAQLTRAQVLALGRVVGDMLDDGSPPDVARGFGVTWNAGVRLPRDELDGLFRQFTVLEVTVGSVLAGRDLRPAERASRPTGLGALFATWLSGPRSDDSQASQAIEQSGELAKRGLIALWNAWVAMRYRALIPRPTFELLVAPWVTVIGPLPEP
jgi:hypothetical protein